MPVNPLSMVLALSIFTADQSTSDVRSLIPIARPASARLEASTEEALAPSVRMAQEKVLVRLQIQQSLREARRLGEKGEFGQAIEVLEEQLVNASGSDSFLTALESAYRGEIARLLRENKGDEARVLSDRLRVLAPGVDPKALTDEVKTKPRRQLLADASKTEVEQNTEPKSLPPKEKSPPSNKDASSIGRLNLFSKTIQSLQTKLAPGSARSKDHAPADTVDEVSANQLGERTYEARGKLEELPKASAVGESAFEKAEKLFKQAAQTSSGAGGLSEEQREKFIEALPLYEKAYEEDAVGVQVGRKRWGYCLLVASIKRFNDLADQPDVSIADWAELQADFKLAGQLASTDRIQQSVNEALARIADYTVQPSTPKPVQEASYSIEQPKPSVAPVNVRHTGRHGQWQVAETQNFRIYHRNRKLAEEIGRLAEEARQFSHQKWFPGEPLTQWSPKCNFFLYPNASEYARHSNAPPESPGRAEVQPDGAGRIVSRNLYLRADYPNMRNTVLPHEVTHLVLAGRFGPHPVPRWADEGIAILTEPRAQQEAHLRNLVNCQFSGRQMGVPQVMTASDYPGGRLRDFYAHSTGICRFLVERGGSAKLIEFVRTALRGQNYEAALRQVYGINGFAELQQNFGQYIAQLNGPAGPATARR